MGKLVGLDGRTIEDNGAAAQREPETGGYFPEPVTYSFLMKSGAEFVASGTLVATGAFCAIISSPTTYEFMAPWDAIESVVKVSEDDTEQAA